MADEQQLAILTLGVDEWNAWRVRNPCARIDLKDADLSSRLLAGADLSCASLERTNLAYSDAAGANLQNSNLSEAQLQRATLSGADFRLAQLLGANLAFTNLSRATLRHAQLAHATLVNTVLANADLRGADLERATLKHAELSGASLSDAALQDTVLADIDLRTVTGLEAVRFFGPSTIGLDTLVRSCGEIPATFLRGCGVPDSVIAYARSLVAAPIEFYSCFISHSSKDQEFVRRLYDSLQGQNVRCWYAPENLKIGDRFRDVIHDSIRLHDKLLLVLSENSVNSIWVREEAESALRKEQRLGTQALFPIRLDDAVLVSKHGWAEEVCTRHVGDFVNWKSHDAYQRALARLLRDLKADAPAVPASPLTT